MKCTAPLSVLMSIYDKERPEYLVECLDSLLAQTVLASEWVIVEDGPLTDEIYSVLNDYESRHPGLIKRIPLEKNVGLGDALRIGIQECSYEIVARMDTDDISAPKRFEEQVKLFKDYPDLDICGSHIAEFEGSIDNIVGVRKVPLSDAEIKQYQKRRDAFNHPAVMYKKQSVLKAGNYQYAPLMEDSLLWVNMIVSGAQCMNYDGYLVYMRTDGGLYDRRGGFRYYRQYRQGRKRIYETGYISSSDYYCTLFAQLIVALLPKRLRRSVFLHALRNENELPNVTPKQGDTVNVKAGAE